MKKSNFQKKQLVVYQAKSGAIELRRDTERETIWATQAQMAEIFGVNPQAITKHLKNIYHEAELERSATCSILEQVQKEGLRLVKRHVEVYNLDLLLNHFPAIAGSRPRREITQSLNYLYFCHGEWKNGCCS